MGIYMMRFLWRMTAIVIVMSGCGVITEHESKIIPLNQVPTPTVVTKGQWVVNDNGQPMENPQTSGLTAWRDGFLSLSDRSAELHHQQRIHFIDTSAQLAPVSLPIHYSQTIRNSCFGEYLTANPDLEALAVSPHNDQELVMVTEDASYSPLSRECAEQYSPTGSTPFPTLLVRLLFQQDHWLASAVRPVQFSKSQGLGNFPNDGFEGLVFDKNSTLYMALEKDGSGNPRIFTVDITDSFWQSQTFVEAQSPEISVPSFSKGRHPINGLSLYTDSLGTEWLIAAARNDNQLWLIDTNDQHETRIIDVEYYSSSTPSNDECEPQKVMHTSGIEGVAVAHTSLWLINDPWKEQYLHNIECDADAQTYQQFSPLLFEIPLDEIFH